MKADEIFINNLVVHTIIGVLPAERINQQPVELDLTIKTDITRAARSESLEDTLDYAAIASGLASYIHSSTFLLIETLAEAIVTWLWQFSPTINEVSLELRKPMAVQQASTVGLRITRCRL